ncbi:orotate phosphoribosyltransferase [Ignatzschineria ureiclastica]|uniref:Orotate phosphoribosyltransferase n=1 Tax=Ignatzschineria ureiclastica TaxID=472582 RepID=A0A2U2AD49_9GAMM|nr:orotate phosphoribosyltransferase [Ignatzschineria ureiclastica]PWD80489.1 orotate phosphoribosyltransferase [Ignatzschineria ureiclastica]GGZ99095.1 orotate phosphoribosyltransferase [Ignatzschineria ureiclastica]
MNTNNTANLQHDETVKHKVAEALLSIDAVSLSPNDPFTWASGLKSPIYCDNRLIVSHPEVRKFISKNLIKLIQENFPEVEVIAGTATAGIPHASWVSAVLEKPMVYVRSSPKKHGRGNMIEGIIKPGQKVVIVEDLISTGGSSLTCADALKEAGAEVIGVAAIFSYDLPIAAENFGKAGLHYATLSNYPALLETALSKNIISEEERVALTEWNKDPSSWGK